ncbi:hypothetical protein [Psychromonas ossibalaenae]|uniref:hypothetical protein n=1 Tax=Psychromonas ossibalaenae TaxID=444922 RepID=UPI00036D776B|nr:hypothetical protein [Psychromonas ossibalaenae]
MIPELYFIYDSHCPWSYASLPLVNALEKAYPEMIIHVWHCAHYDGSDSAGYKQMDDAAHQSTVKFGQEHIRFVDSPKNSTMTANLMAWLQNKQPQKTLAVLNALQKAHFIDGNVFGCKHDFNALIEQFKLSPPNKVFRDELSDEALYTQSDIQELREFIGTNAFPVLLLAADDNATLLNHSLYLADPDAIVEAVKRELK